MAAALQTDTRDPVARDEAKAPLFIGGGGCCAVEAPEEAVTAGGCGPPPVAVAVPLLAADCWKMGPRPSWSIKVEFPGHVHWRMLGRSAGPQRPGPQQSSSQTTRPRLGAGLHRQGTWQRHEQPRRRNGGR